MSVLGTPDQIAAEKRVLHIIASREVAEARTKARAIMAAHPIAASPAASARIDEDLDRWIVQLAMQEADVDLANPSIVWATTLTSYHWFGHDFPASAAAIDNLDNIYRHAALDGSSRYEITGKFGAQTQLVFQLSPHPEGMGFASNGNAGVGDRMASLATLTNRMMDIRPDGTFRVILDQSPAPGMTNHIRLSPGKLMLTIRDTLTDWKQSPVSLTIRRTAGPDLPSPPDETAIIRNTAAHLPGFVRFWLDFIENFQGMPAENRLVGPYGRTGGWGFAATSRFRLRADQAMLITVRQGGAGYMSIQTTDPWMSGFSATRYLATYNVTQSKANTDGSLSYIVAPRDPGVANWVDTGGLEAGYVFLRWQGVSPDAVSDDLIQDFRIVDVASLKAVLPPGFASVSPDERKAEIDQRARDWRTRVAVD